MQAIGLLLAEIGWAIAGLGVGGYTAVAIGAAVVVGGSIAAAKAMGLFEIEMPQMDSDASRQTTIKSTVAPQKIIYGEALVSGPISYIALSGANNADLYQTIVLAGHKVNAITDVHFDDEVITNAQIAAGLNTGSNTAGNVTGGTFGPIDSNTICIINKHLGTASEASDPMLTNKFDLYTSAHRGEGIAYLAMKWTLDEDSAEVWEKYSPGNVKALVQGKQVYDPRLEVTAGGTAGANPTTAAYVVYSTNPALCVTDYLIDQNLGMGIAANKIDWAAVITAANGCDVDVNVPNNQTQKRFTANGVLFATDSHQKNINKLLSAMNGRLIYSNGKYIVKAGIYEAPTEVLTEDDLIGAIQIKTSLERSDRFNTIRGIFVDAAANNKSTEFPKVQLADAVTRDNGEVLEKEIQLPMVSDSYQAQRIANKLIQLSDQQKIVSFPANLSALRITAGDRVQVTVSELGWTNKVFECIGWTFSDDGGVNLTLREDSSTSYGDPLPAAYSQITSDGVIADGFRGVPSPSGLRAASGEKKVFLNWVNPGKPSDFGTIEIYASASNNIANAVKIGETDGTQFVHDGNNAADQIAVGNTRVYWVRSKKNVGTVADDAVSVYQPNSTTGVGPVTVLATLVDWDNVANPTIGIDINNDTISINTGSATTTTGQTVAKSGIEAGTTVTQGGITMNQGGSIKGGQSAYNSGTGFFLGYDTNKYKFSIGNASNEALTFDGTNLAVTGAITATSGSIANSVTVGGTAASTVASDAAAGNQAADQISLLPRADDSEWTVGNGAKGIWSLNGETSENAVVVENGPHGELERIWKATSTDGSGADGGFQNTATDHRFPIASDTAYRFSVFIKQDNTNGTVYLGAYNYGSNGLATSLYRYDGDSPTTNRYWFANDLPTQGEWFLLVGFVNPSNTNSNSGKGGIYNLATGVKVTAFDDFRFSGDGSETDATTFAVRTYNFYGAASPTSIVRWAHPRVDRLDRRAPSIAELLRGWTSLAEPINAGVTITGGGITMDSGGAIKGGQSAYNNGTGFFLGYDTNAYKFSIGNSGNNSLAFDGTNLAVTGAITATSGTFTGSVSIGSTGAIYGGTMSSFNTGAGFFLGYDTDAYKFSVGNASSKVLTWDGDNLNVQANLVSFTTAKEQVYSSLSRLPPGVVSAARSLGSNSDYFYFDSDIDVIQPSFVVSYSLGALTSGSISGQTNSRNAIVSTVKLELFYATASYSGTPGTWTSWRSRTFTSSTLGSGQPSMSDNTIVVRQFDLGGGNWETKLLTREEYREYQDDDYYSTLFTPNNAVDDEYYLNWRVDSSSPTVDWPAGAKFIKVVATITNGSYTPYPSTGSPSTTETRVVSIPGGTLYEHENYGSAIALGGQAWDNATRYIGLDGQTNISGGEIIIGAGIQNPAQVGDTATLKFVGFDEDGGSIRKLSAIEFHNGISTLSGTPDFQIFVPNAGNVLAFSGDVNFGSDVDVDGTLSINGVTVNAGAVTGPAGSDHQVQFNNIGSLGASSDFTFDDSTGTLTVTNLAVSGTTANVSGDINLKAANSDVGINWVDSDDSVRAWSMYANPNQPSTLFIDYNPDGAGTQPGWAFANNGNFLASGSVYADGAASNSTQWKTGYDYSQIGHLPLTGGTISQNLTITGNLTVNGTTTTVNTDNLTVKDNNIILNYSTGDSSSTANNAGITIQDAVNSTTDASLLWKTASDTFEFSHGANIPKTYVNATSQNAESGTWTNAPSSGNWGTIKFGAGYAWTDTVGGYKQFNIPTGADTCYMSQLKWSSGGYVDVHAVQADGDLVFLGRIGTGQSVENNGHGNAAEHDGQAIEKIGSGLDAFSAIRITNRRGRFHLTGLAFSTQQLDNFNGGMIAAEMLASGVLSNVTNTNWDAAYTYSQVGHLPLAGGTLTGVVSWPSGSSTNANTAYSRVASTNIGLNVQGLVNFTAVGDYSKPGGYQTMMRGTGLVSTVVGTPKVASYWLYNVMAKRDTGGGTAALLMNYTGDDFYYGFTTTNTAAPAWRRVWDDNNFAQSDVNNWGAAYTYSQVGHLPLSGGTLTGAVNISASSATTKSLTITSSHATNGAAIVVGNTVTDQTYVTGSRPMVVADGVYPVLNLNNTVTSNSNHGPTIQFTYDGYDSNRQIVIGTDGQGQRLDFGFSGGSSGTNTNKNPHNGIGGYSGITAMRLFPNGLLVGATGTYPNEIASINNALDVRGTMQLFVGNDSVATDQSGLTLTLAQTYSDGRYEHRFRKRDEGGGIPLYVDSTQGTANAHTQIARFGAYTGQTDNFEVYGTMSADGYRINNTSVIDASRNITAVTISSGAITSAGSQGVKVIQNQQIQNPPSTDANFYQGIGFRNAASNHAYSIGYGQGGRFVLNYFDNSSTYSRILDIASTGNATFSGTISSGAITSSGKVQAAYLKATSNIPSETAANRAYLDFFSGDTRIISKGPDGSTLGGFRIIQQAKDGSPSTASFVIDTSSNATFAGTISTNTGNHSTITTRNRFTTPHGYIELGPMNASWAHIYTDRPAFYTNKQIYVLNQLVLNTGNYQAYSNFTGPVKVNAGHSTTRLQLVYTHTNDTGSGTLTGWASEPGLTYSDAGIGANINLSGQYYGRQINSGYGVYARFRKSNGAFEVWNTAGTAGASGGQGTQRLNLSYAGVLNLPTGSLNVQSVEVISSGRQISGTSYRVGTTQIIDASRNATFGTTVYSAYNMLVNSTAPSWTYNDSSTRAKVYVSDTYPVLTLNTESNSNANHGATLQFTGSGYGTRKQWVIGSSNTLAQLDFGWATNSNGNPHYGIAGLAQNGYTGATLMRITPTGVGIGGNWGYYGTVANPAFPLHVQGNAAATGNITAYYSDERLKTKTGTLTNALAKVLSLEGFTYLENDLAKELGYENEQQQVGVSAQQVKMILPEAVSLAPVDVILDEDTGELKSKSGEEYLTVDYSRIVPLLIEAVKELTQKVSTLENKLKEK